MDEQNKEKDAATHAWCHRMVSLTKVQCQTSSCCTVSTALGNCMQHTHMQYSIQPLLCVVHSTDSAACALHRHARNIVACTHLHTCMHACG